jgi:hypothetical protein
MITPVEPLVLIELPGVYGLYVAPLSVLNWYESLQPPPPEPGVNVALTPWPPQTADRFGLFVANVGPLGCALMVTVALPELVPPVMPVESDTAVTV